MLVHWIWLSRRRGIGVRGRISLLRLFGSAEAIYEMGKSDYLAREGFERRMLEPLLDKSLDDAEEILAKCEKKHIQVMTLADADYPDRLRGIADPPIVLYYRGRLPEFDREVTIGVVGSRRCSAYGLLHARQFARLIAASGGIVISGGARGIDTMALRGALDSAMPVVCVLGCGVDVIYPKENRYIFEEVARHGCLLSELPPGSPPEAGNFPVRNRILSGLSLGVLVVEAPEKSGALITAQHALEQGRDVFAVPGNIGLKHCEGSNRLLREGAFMVENGWEVVREYASLYQNKISDGRSKEALERVFRARFGSSMQLYTPVALGEELCTRPSERKKHREKPAPRTPDDKKVVDNSGKTSYHEPKEPPAGLSSEEQSLLALLEDTPRHTDELVAASGLPAQKVLAALTMLQIKKLAQKASGNRYQRM